MAWAPGPQQVSSITVGAGNAISGDLIENYSSQTEGTSYDSAKGFSVDRGFVTNTITFDCLDYSEVGAIETLMSNRTLNDVNVTYLDSVTKDITANSVARITPLVNLVPDTCNFWVKAAAGNFNDLTNTFTDAGVVMSDMSFDFSFPFDGTDGCGRPYFGGVVAAEISFELSGIRGASTDIHGTTLAGIGFGANVDAAFALPNSYYMGFKDMYMYYYFGPEDSTGVRTVSVTLRGTNTLWRNMLFFTDGVGPTANEEGWGTGTTYDLGDTYVGGSVELVGTDDVEGNLVSF